MSMIAPVQIAVHVKPSASLVLRYVTISNLVFEANLKLKEFALEVSPLNSLGIKRFTPASTAASMAAFCMSQDRVVMQETTASWPLNISVRALTSSYSAR